MRRRRENQGATLERLLPLETARGSVLNVPLLTRSPWSYELEVFQRMPLHDSDVFLCKIRNVVADEELFDESRSVEERLRLIRPIATTCQTYLSYDGSDIGRWGEPRARLGNAAVE